MFIVFFRTLIIYVIIIVCLRIMGKRQLGELQPSEFVIAILISNIATLSIEDTDIPLLGAVVPIITLMSSEVILSYITLKSGKAQIMVTGNPVPVIRNGSIDQKSMRDLRFSIEDLMSQLRINGIFDVQEVDRDQPQLPVQVEHEGAGDQGDGLGHRGEQQVGVRP